MKKKIFGVALIAAVAVTTGWNFNQSKNNIGLSGLALANAEALANNESGIPTIPCEKEDSKSCSYIVKDANGNHYNATTQGMKNKY